MKLKLTLIALSLAALTACGGGGGDSGGGGINFATLGATPAAAAPAAPEPQPKPTKACTVLLYGDSVMVGEPLVQEGPARRMRRLRPNWTVDMRAVAGTTGSQGAAAAMDHAFPNPSVVVMEWGTNDAAFGTNPIPAMRALIDKVRADGNRSIITGPPPRTSKIAEWLTVRSNLQALGSDTQTPFVGWGGAPLATLDGIHPTQASSNTLVDDLIAVIDKECER